MNTNNDVTGDRITNALKGDKDKYRENWEAIFGDSKKHEDGLDKKLCESMSKVYNDLSENSQTLGLGISSKELWGFYEDTDEEILDKLTQDNEDMGMYDD